MDIGLKIKNARIDNGFTQEEIAEKLGVSRQSVSNWENNRSYPDIISVTKLSDIYSISMDELLKEDTKMLEHLEKNTNVVKKKSMIIKIVEICSFLLIWICCTLSFLTQGKDISVNSQIAINIVILPLIYYLFSLIISFDKSWGNFKYGLPFIFGLMNFITLIASNYTYSGNVTSMFVKTYVFTCFAVFSIGFVLSCFGIIMASIFLKITKIKK